MLEDVLPRARVVAEETRERSLARVGAHMAVDVPQFAHNFRAE